MIVESDRIGPFAATVYRIRAGDDVELAVTRLWPEEGAIRGVPVVLVHGTFCQRSFFVSPKGVGLGPYLLAEGGFDVWIPELRGHGRSPRDRRFSGWTAEDQMRWDLPAIQALVAAETGRRAVHWVGHSWGGVALLGAQAGGWMDPDGIRSAVVLGANITEGDEWLKDPFRRALVRIPLALLGRVPARLFGLGPEPESAAYLLDFYDWKGVGGRWRTRGGRDYWAGFPAITAPLLAFAAADDPNDPPSGCRTMFEAVGSPDKRFVLLAKSGSFSRDYRHVEMIVSKAAAEEVWPRIAAWLRSH